MQPVCQRDDGSIRNACKAGTDHAFGQLLRRAAQIPAGVGYVLGAGVATPTLGGHVIVGACIHHTVAGVGVGQVVARLPAVESKLHDLHARVAAFGQHRLHLRGQVAQILGDDIAAAQRLLHGVDKVPVGAFFPVTACSRFVFGRDGVVTLETAEVVDAHHIVDRGGVLHAPLPPVKAGGLVGGPIIQRVAPQLSVCRKGIRRAAGYMGQVHLSISLEQLRVGPQVTGIRADVDGDIAHQQDTFAVGIGLQRVPLGVEEELHRLVVADLVCQPCLCGGNDLRLPAAQGVRPVGKACLPLLSLYGHEQGVVLQPEALRGAEGLVSRGGGCQQPVSSLFQQHRALIVQCTVVNGVHRLRGGDLFGGQIAICRQQPKIDKVGVSGKGGKALVGAVAIAGRADGQDLPIGLFCLGQKINECGRFTAQRTDAKRPRQAEHRHQNAACTHNVHLLSPLQHRPRHPR